MTASARQVFSLARSFLFVPATRPERFVKALASSADAVIIDLEDAVAPAEKVEARNRLARAWPGLSGSERARVLVRVNPSGTAWHDDDLSLLASLGAGGVVLPKAEGAAQLVHAAGVLGSECSLIALVESVAGLDGLDALARCPQVVRLAFGNLDFQADACMACGRDEAELHPVRLAFVLASRRAKLAPPVDGVTADIQNVAQLTNDVERSRRFGFAAKLCIHPTQVAPVNAALAPTPAELDWARRALAASEASGGAVVSLDGRMVDAPVLRMAERAVACADRRQSG